MDNVSLFNKLVYQMSPLLHNSHPTKNIVTQHTHTPPKSPNNKNKKTPKTNEHCRSKNHHNSTNSNNLQETKTHIYQLNA